ncbi:hypothetical protein [Aromatoleum petrolei]|uniref:Uncharacterized protein n=1 Tax=Aromatoleum petrolei TaxID=76116 RepID=A0ABX1MHI8_9RHOO|nr:hypothetical protein [Aromatoleum petrolei]NMF87243.1 hypothetical protein [Aromatoleum petrolei]
MVNLFVIDELQTADCRLVVPRSNGERANADHGLHVIGGIGQLGKNGIKRLRPTGRMTQAPGAATTSWLARHDSLLVASASAST